METNSEQFTKAFAETWAEWVEKGKAGERQICFPLEVIDSLKKLGPPSWDQVDAAIEKLFKEDRLEQTILDLECLINDEDSFRWPLSGAPGKGNWLGSLESRFECVRWSNVSAYLEATSPRNVPLYERHGFEAVGSIQVPG
jgi:hypothetical protein